MQSDARKSGSYDETTARATLNTDVYPPAANRHDVQRHNQMGAASNSSPNFVAPPSAFGIALREEMTWTLHSNNSGGLGGKGKRADRDGIICHSPSLTRKAPQLCGPSASDDRLVLNTPSPINVLPRNHGTPIRSGTMPISLYPPEYRLSTKMS